MKHQIDKLLGLIFLIISWAVFVQIERVFDLSVGLIENNISYRSFLEII